MPRNPLPTLTTRFIASFCLAVIACCGGPLFPRATGAAANAKSPMDSVQWVKGPIMTKMKSIAEIHVPADCSFTGAEGTKTVMKAMGNPISGTELGFLAPTSMVWFVLFEFSDVGYVKDDDKDKLDADAMLKAIKAGTERANEERKKMGAAAVHVTGWEQPPSYNPQNNNLEWAIRGESEGRPIINYNTRLLGRKGVMRVSLIVDPEKLVETMPVFKDLMTSYAFQSGSKYAEYHPGDKIAEYGLAALVTGGTAAVALKLGFFAVIAKFFKAFWKLVVFGVLALATFFKRLFGGRNTSQQ